MHLLWLIRLIPLARGCLLFQGVNLNYTSYKNNCQSCVGECFLNQMWLTLTTSVNVDVINEGVFLCWLVHRAEVRKKHLLFNLYGLNRLLNQIGEHLSSTLSWQFNRYTYLKLIRSKGWFMLPLQTKIDTSISNDVTITAHILPCSFMLACMLSNTSTRGQLRVEGFWQQQTLLIPVPSPPQLFCSNCLSLCTYEVTSYKCLIFLTNSHNLSPKSSTIFKHFFVVSYYWLQCQWYGSVLAVSITFQKKWTNADVMYTESVHVSNVEHKWALKQSVSWSTTCVLTGKVDLKRTHGLKQQ